MQTSSLTFTRLLENLKVSVSYAQLRGNMEWIRVDETPGFNRLYYIADGEGKVILNGTSYEPKPGQLLIMPAGTRQTTNTSSENPYLRYICHFDARIGEWPLFHASNRLYMKQAANPEMTISVFSELIEQFHHGGPFATMRTQAALLILLASCLEEEGEGAADFIKDFMQGTERDKLAAVLSYIDEHLGEELLIDRLAELVHLHPNYFIPYFKKHMGMTPMHYVQQKRLEEAKRLLSFSDCSVSEVADRIGLGLTHFSRHFKKVTGITPSAYRNHTR
ncbi:AraC family transcriptional regulator [Paenibacillus mucilaginosus]|uniref:AraC family transcriptional regulator n=1 Tax=Paenibacillus mucilaginosus (strain KNP414) TaxID=1036673 RepID=F8FQ69_PAEMK|nr:AraC family transcriptional regulator [Paenibacillus mucilaginosus]AEI40289.1 AraC family transcriptional regulator [Paenibacillus mucilaginosus KNP414]MCG7213350.1 AraC family transcriptional regulator [Paenibacillus mucilaginosus]WDM29499.1 helix-turn-helix domain-containing protein [Paenibacillus mucilaginosus]